MSIIPDRRPAVLALHGFTLGGAMFTALGELIDARLVAPDLPGHGGRDGAATAWPEAVTEVTEHIARHRPDVVVGYSMGGRIALAAALKTPGDYTLVMMSASVGVETASARLHRAEADEELAARIEESSVTDFIAQWEQAELLGGHSELSELRRRNTPTGLAAALRGMGQGAQPYLGDQLSRLENPVVWMAGELDTKYVAIATLAAQHSARSRLVIVPQARHNVVADAPQAVAKVVNESLATRRTV